MNNLVRANRRTLPVLCFVAFALVLAIGAILVARNILRTKPTTPLPRTMVQIAHSEKTVQTDGVPTNLAASPDGSLIIVSLAG